MRHGGRGVFQAEETTPAKAQERDGTAEEGPVLLQHRVEATGGEVRG